MWQFGPPLNTQSNGLHLFVRLDLINPARVSLVAFIKNFSNERVEERICYSFQQKVSKSLRLKLTRHKTYRHMAGHNIRETNKQSQWTGRNVFEEKRKTASSTSPGPGSWTWASNWSGRRLSGRCRTYKWWWWSHAHTADKHSDQWWRRLNTEIRGRLWVSRWSLGLWWGTPTDVGWQWLGTEHRHTIIQLGQLLMRFSCWFPRNMHTHKGDNLSKVMAAETKKSNN